MTLTVINRKDGDEAAMFGDDMLDLARELADQLSKTGGHWVVIKTTAKEEVVYEAMQEE